MKPMRGRWMKTGALLVLGLGFSGLSSGLSTAAQVQTLDGRELLLRLQRLERDMRDLQAETFRRAPGDRALPPGALAPAPPPAVEPVQPAMPDLNPLMRRMGELEESLSRLTGQMEELGHQADQLSQKADRLQKQMDVQAAQASAAAAAGMPPEPTDTGDAVASLTPAPNAPILRPFGAPPANLGQIQSGTPLPTPAVRPVEPTPVAPPADPRREYDAAMNLLSRAQYDRASQAFRNFADAYPDEARAADALYWTGDIAYSAKKDYDEAARDFAELLKKYPKAQRAPEGMLKLGLALFELGQMREGCAALAALPARYPDAAVAVATRARTERRDKMCR